MKIVVRVLYLIGALFVLNGCYGGVAKRLCSEEVCEVYNSQIDGMFTRVCNDEYCVGLSFQDGSFGMGLIPLPIFFIYEGTYDFNIKGGLSSTSADKKVREITSYDLIINDEFYSTGFIDRYIDKYVDKGKERIGISMNTDYKTKDVKSAQLIFHHKDGTTFTVLLKRRFVFFGVA